MIYDEEFRRTIDAGSFLSADVVVPRITELVPESGTRDRTVVDVGCGEGQWLSVFKQHGFEVLGIDSGASAHYLEPAEYMDVDIQTTFPAGLEADLWITLEVAEHLFADRAEPLVDFLTSIGPLGIFSAAIPGQGGTHHVNEQWPEYWVEKFEARGFQCSGALRFEFWNDDRVENWYRQNIMVVWDGSRGGNDKLHELFELPTTPMFPVVHPVLYRHKTGAA